MPEPDTRNQVSIRNPGNHEPAFLLHSWIPHSDQFKPEGILAAAGLSATKILPTGGVADKPLPMSKLYIETTIPSFYYNQRTEPEMVARCNWTRQ